MAAYANGLFHIGSRPVTPLATLLVVVLMGLLAVVATRSTLWLVVPAAFSAWVARRIGLRTGFIKWVDHRVLERLSETFDNVEGWIVAFIACAVVLTLFRVRDNVSRSRP